MKFYEKVLLVLMLASGIAYGANEWHQPSNAIFHGTVTETGLNAAGIVTNTAGGLLGTVNPVPVTKGGTALQTATTNGVLYGNGTSAFGVTGAGTQYQTFQAGASGIPTVGALHLDQSAAVTGILPNANTTATNANTASAIVTRDGSGNFTAGTITAALTGNVTGNVTGSASLNVLKAGDTMTGPLNIVLGSDAVAHTIKGASAGTADLLSLQNSTGTVMLNVDIGGNLTSRGGTFVLGNTAASRNGYLDLKNGGRIDLEGGSSGVISLLPQSTAGTYNWNYPTTAGTSGQPLISAGGGSSPMTFGTLGVAGGGTGNATFTAYGLLAAGTTATGALQQVSGTGTSGQVLTSAGAGALPAWQTAAAGGGGLNFVGLATSFLLTSADDITAESSTGNWATYADAAGTDPVDMTGGSATALTLSRTTTAGEVLDGSGSFKIVKAASNAQGMGVSVLVNLPPGYRGQNMQYTIPFHIISGSIAAGDLKFEVYDVTNSGLLSASCNVGSSTVANSIFTTGTVLVICNGVIPSTTAQIRIGFHFASTSTTAVTFSWDDVYVAPPNNIGTAGIAVDWDCTNYAVTFSAGFGTVSSPKTCMKRVGDTAHFRITVTTGTVAGSAVFVTLPSSIVIDTSKLAPVAINTGVWEYLGGTGNLFTTTGGYGPSFYDGSTNNQIFLALSSGSSTLAKANGNAIFANASPATIDFSVPISQWANTGTVFNPSQRANQFYASSKVSSASSSVTSASFVTFSNSPALTFTPGTTGNYTVRASIPLYADASGTIGVARVTNTTGGGTLLQESQATVYGSAGATLASGDVTSTYTLSAGTSYVFDIQGLRNAGSGNIVLKGDVSNFYMFAEPESQNTVWPIMIGTQSVVNGSDVVNLKLTEASGQTSDIFQGVNSTGTTLAKVDSSGNFLGVGEVKPTKDTSQLYNNFGTVTSPQMVWTEKNHYLCATFSGTTGTLAGSTFSITLPSSKTVDTSFYTSGQYVLGRFFRYTSAGTTNNATPNGPWPLFYDTANSIITIALNYGTGTSLFVNNTAPSAFIGASGPFWGDFCVVVSN